MSNTSSNAPIPSLTFDGLGIAPRLLQILDTLKFTSPTPIQHKSIPVAIEGKDIIGIAQTGTGKTLAFGVPMIQRLAQRKGMGLVLLPTRELAIQVNEHLQKIGRSIGMRTALLIGGASMGMQRREIKARPHIIISTPGRLIDILHQRFLTLKEVNVVALDEADRMLDIGFAPQINELANQHMQLPLRVEVAPSGTAAEKVEQELIVVRKDEKLRLLEKLLYDYHGSVLVFSRTKHAAKRITQEVRDMGHRAAEIHSNRSLGQRREALEGFKSGKYRVLIATDIAARGIDVTGIELVINFDLPDSANDYVHRIGRTGRAGHAGRAISFATPDQQADVNAIERVIKSVLPKTKVAGFADEQLRPTYGKSFSGRRSFGGRGRFGGSRRPSFTPRKRW